jgi:hypothetical protein
VREGQRSRSKSIFGGSVRNYILAGHLALPAVSEVLVAIGNEFSQYYATLPGLICDDSDNYHLEKENFSQS